MTTKKLLFTLGAVIITVVVLIGVFVGGIVGVVFYSIGNSEAATVARDFLRNNEKLKQDIGDVKDFGSLVTGSINVDNGSGVATLQLSVEGERKTVNATVKLMYRSGGQWRVTEASYKNDAGQTIYLLDAYDAKLFHPSGFLK